MRDIFDGIIKRIATFVFTTFILCRLGTSSDPLLSPSTLPTVYMPEKSDHITLNGFPQAIILSQRGQRYSSNLDCTLTIQVRQKYAVQLTVEHLDIHQESYGDHCDDYLQLYSGPNKEVILTRPYCGQRPPRYSLVSNSTSVTIRFRTNQFREKTGFRLRYERIPVGDILECDADSGLCVAPSNLETFRISRKRRSSAISNSSCLAVSSGNFVALCFGLVIIVLWHQSSSAMLFYSKENR